MRRQLVVSRHWGWHCGLPCRGVPYLQDYNVWGPPCVYYLVIGPRIDGILCCFLSQVSDCSRMAITEGIVEVGLRTRLASQNCSQGYNTGVQVHIDIRQRMQRGAPGADGVLPL